MNVSQKLIQQGEIIMTFKELKKKIKEEQKSLAQNIKEKKSKRKKVDNGYVDGLEIAKIKYRHIHISYCTFFNDTPYGMIEQTCHEDPNKNRIDELKKNWENQIDEVICDSA